MGDPGTLTQRCEPIPSRRNRLPAFARRSEALDAADDRKLQGALREIEALLADGFHPVVFCRFVDTAGYVARHLRTALAKGVRGVRGAQGIRDVRVEAVTGRLPPAEREARIASLAAEGGRFVLVCTDFLSEGINLQDHFDAVLHYDLAWNPTRHEQREGRVDRFGQRRPEVRVITHYGRDNPIDGVILDVLIRKHKSIKSSLGVTVAVPGSSEQIAKTLFKGALFRERAGVDGRQLDLDFIDDLDRQMQAIHAGWENARDREKASRSRFAQHALSPEEVAAELEQVRAAIGRSEDVGPFLDTVLHAANVPVQGSGGAVTVHLGPGNAARPPADHRVRRAVHRALRPSAQGRRGHLGRTSPVVEGLATWTLDQALDPASRDGPPVASRCGAIRTSAVSARTTLLVARFRYHLRSAASAEEGPVLCEEIAPLACTGSAAAPGWLSPEESERLLAARPEGNLLRTAIEQQLGLLLPALPELRAALEAVARERAQAQLGAHRRVRAAARARGRVDIEPVLPVDLLGAYVLLPPLPGPD